METTISKEHNFPISFIQYVMARMKVEFFITLEGSGQVTWFLLLLLLNTKITTHTSNNTIHIKQTSSDYIIEYDGNSKYQGVKLSTLLNAFTYGTRTVKGDPMLLDIFKKFELKRDQHDHQKLVLVLYNEWKEAYGY